MLAHNQPSFPNGPLTPASPNDLSIFTLRPQKRHDHTKSPRVWHFSLTSCFIWFNHPWLEVIPPAMLGTDCHPSRQTPLARDIILIQWSIYLNSLLPTLFRFCS